MTPKISNMKLEYNADDIFEEIPGDPDNVIMNIPLEVLAQTGWKEGDELDITVEDGAIVLKKHG
jgi:AbrB family looped-hinge helix DNA binding protein